uniref:Putative tick transposon n=1 Tax=Rhipicephalus pulchellus TaxID=72859 RepID=L7LW83_RHIPC
MYRTPPSSREPSPCRREDIDAGHDQRASRRQQGLPPEYGPLPDKTRKTTATTTTAATMTAPVSPAAIVIQPPREPPTFHGSPSEDPETWLDTFERVSTFNNWDSEDKLRHVYFYLEDAARTWFENRESTLRTWDLFRSAFLETFASVVRKERAAALLETRVQLPNESVAIFTEEMIRLFRHADPAMPEDKKVRFLMRGVKQELFAGLMRNPPSTVQEFVSEVTTIEKTLEMRTRQYNRRSIQDGPALHTIGTDDLRETIRAVVREELRRMIPSFQPQVASIADIVREEIQQSLGTPEPPQPQPQAMSYAAVARRDAPPRRPRQGAVPTHFRRQTPPPPTPYRPPASQRCAPRKTDVWRTPDHRPLCYHCGEAGHTYRRCQYRDMGLRGFDVNAPRPQPGERPRDIADYLSGAQRTPRRPRSPSPGGYVSPQRRPYTGPTQGRSPSPYPEN